ncbi:hypothetical protein OF846_005227 [Rhodotorula toruloides]|nr:hypothetical protein OF846_005227 [Rhodotorula toruloides]
MLPHRVTPRPLQPVSLAELAALAHSSSLPPQGVYRASILSVRPWSPHTRLGQVTLGGVISGEAGDAVVVELKGLWADKAMRRFRKGDIVILLAKGAELIEKKGKKLADAAEKELAVRVRYSQGLTGWIRRKDGTEEVLRYKVATPKPAPTVPAKRPHPLKAMDVDSPLPLPTSRPSAVTPALTTKVSPPNEGARAKKRQRREERLGWGFETADKITYTSLDKLGHIVEKTDRTKLQALRVNVVGVIVDAGEGKAPRVDGRDWYRSFLITDPTRLDSSTEVQWYAKGEGGLPEPRLGEVFVARQLALKSSSTPAKPILLAGSFSLIPHALCSASSLLAKPPAQDPLPSGDDIAPATKTSNRCWRLKLGEEELQYAARVARFFATQAKASTPSAAKGAPTLPPGAAILPPSLAASVTDHLKKRTSAGGSGRELLRIEQIEEGKFCDLLGMVTKLHSDTALTSLSPNQAASLYITDYTPHLLLHDYPSPSPVGLPSRLTLQVSLFGSQAAPLAALVNTRTGEATRGALVFLRNVRIKANESGELEGTMVEEKKFAGRTDVEVVDLRRKAHEERWGERARQVQRRHREYWAAQSLARQ